MITLILCYSVPFALLPLDGGRILSFSNSKACWSLLGSHDFTRMDGERTSGISTQRSIKWARRTHRESKVNTSIYGRGSSDACVVRYAFPKRRRCTIS